MEQVRTFFSRLNDRSPTVLLLTLLAVISIFALASGLTGLELLPGDEGAVGFAFDSMQPGGGSLPIDDRIMTVIRVIYLVFLALLPFYLIYVIFNKEARKRFIRDMILFGSITFILLTMARLFVERVSEEEGIEFPEIGAAGNLPDAPPVGAPLEGGPSQEIIWITSVLVALVVVVVAALIIWFVWRTRRGADDQAIERISIEVQSALDDIQAGVDLRNVVIRCYTEMVQTLRQQRGVQRNTTLTPREFENALEKLGYPIEPVHQLTHLFEAVRYGHKSVSRREELIASDSLTAILNAFRSS